MPIDLSDARACLARAQKHCAELRETIHPERIWRLRERQDRETGEWFGYLDFNRSCLTEAKPIIADCATNAISALDHVAAAIAKARGQDRNRRLYYPLGLSDDDFANACAKHEKSLGGEMLALIAAHRLANLGNVPHVEAAKEIAYSGKHWPLMPAKGAARAVACSEKGKPQRIFQIAEDAFEATDTIEYYRGPDPLPNGERGIVIFLSVEGLSNDAPASPDSIFDCSFRFVQGALDTIAGAWGGVVPAA